MVATLQNNSGIHISTAGPNVVKPQHRLSKLFSQALLGTVVNGACCQSRPLGTPTGEDLR